jgi:hypothetical protein
MFEARQGKEIVVKLGNRIGLLFDIFKPISERGISILAVCGVASGDESVIRLVTDDNLRAMDVLNECEYLVVEEEDVILLELPHKPGMLKRITHALASEEIDVRQIYGSALPGQEKSLVVLRTSNDGHALLRLNKV